MDRVTEENVIAELAGIAFDDGCNDGCGLVVKTADKLRALELLFGNILAWGTGAAGWRRS